VSKDTAASGWLLAASQKAYALLLAVLLPIAAHVEPAEVRPGYEIRLPRDAGSHPEFRTEWWYVTGWVEDDAGKMRGFQVTFFRSRNERADANPSAFAPKQLLFAHAAISDPDLGRLRHAQRSARAGFGLAEASEADTDVRIDDWWLRPHEGGYATRIAADDFTLDLQLAQTQPPMLQGENGFSRKGPDPKSASFYYSLPHLRVSGTIALDERTVRVSGSAWFDHEWSSEYLAEAAQGWDWIGINLNDGRALMAFRIRDRDGGAYWAGSSLRTPAGVRRFEPAEIEWTPLRHWTSARTGVTYPVVWRVRVGELTLTLRPLMDDQESDSRDSVGALYWEGAVEALDERGTVIGRGYLELTGYEQRLKM
jgi:predicted secreted hydrolase